MLSGFVPIGILWRWLCLVLSLLNTGSVADKCAPFLRAQDLFVHLHWNCTGLLPNATFRVEFKVQGSSWSAVAHCDGISSWSCDLSEEISEIDPYVVRLGVEEWHGQLQWSLLACDLLDLVTFSAPSVSARVENGGRTNTAPYIVVEVTFPCAPEKLCLDTEIKQGCCPVWSPLFEVTVTVTLFNRQRPTERKNVTGVLSNQSEDYAANNNRNTYMNVFKLKFEGLDPGQYCVVANFSYNHSISPTSKPVCIELDASSDDLWLVLLGTGLSLLIFIALVVAYLHRPHTHTSDDDLPKALAGLMEQLSSPPIPVMALGILSAEDSPSVISLCSCDPPPDLDPDPDSDPTITQLPSPSPGQHQYFSNPFLEPPTWTAPISNSGGGSVTQDPKVPQFALFGHGGCWDSELQTDCGSLPGEQLTFVMESRRVPLSSLILGMGEEMDCVYLQEGEMVQSGSETATCNGRVELYNSEMEGIGGIFIDSEANLLEGVNEADG